MIIAMIKIISAIMLFTWSVNDKRKVGVFRAEFILAIPQFVSYERELIRMITNKDLYCQI